MTQERIPPTPAQRRLVNIGMLIQFHLAAIGHIVVWLIMFFELMQHPFEEWNSAGGGLLIVFVFPGIPISFGILVAVYILFRWLLAYADFGFALAIMISLNVLHALLMSFTIFVPARLAIPIVLYSFALYHYRTTWLCAQIQARENKDPTYVW